MTLQIFQGSTPDKTSGVSNKAIEDTLTSTTYALMPNQPDQVSGIVVPVDAIVRVGFQGMWKESVNNVGYAAIFIGANQLKRATIASTVPVVQEATGTGTGGAWEALATATHGLIGSGASYVSDVATGQIVGVDTTGGVTEIHSLPAGTYALSVQYKATSGIVTKKEAKLWVEVRSY